jgi:FKBP-type peptidyl-prolyl cis-trans isomerase
VSAAWIAALVLAVAPVGARGRGRPGPNDCVEVHYTGWTRDGAVVASTRRAGAPEVQCLRRAIPEVAAALRRMAVGERRRIQVGPDRSYELELVGIIRAPATPVRLAGPPRSVPRTASGLAVEVLRRGAATGRPALASQVTLHMSGWTHDGTLFESTVMAGRPALAFVRDLIPGLREAVQAMSVGEKTRIWIPAALAYGDHPRRPGQPAGPLVYEVELLAAL